MVVSSKATKFIPKQKQSFSRFNTVELFSVELFKSSLFGKPHDLEYLKNKIRNAINRISQDMLNNVRITFLYSNLFGLTLRASPK